MVILHADKQYLSQLRGEIENYLATNLNLTLKPNWQIFPVAARGVDFLGYRFFHNYTLLRKSIAKNFKQRIRYIKDHWIDLPAPRIINSVMSYYGWLSYANCYNLTKSYIDKDIYRIFANVCKEEGITNPLKG
jgi:hypothetical protein